MHPAFQTVFVHPKNHSLLHFEGDYAGIQWDMGFLESERKKVCFEVQKGIPDFIGLPRLAWDEKAVESLRGLIADSSRAGWTERTQHTLGQKGWNSADRWPNQKRLSLIVPRDLVVVLPP